MINESHIYKLFEESLTLQAEAELSEAKKNHDRLYTQAKSFQTELHVLRNFLLDPGDDTTVAELRIIEQRRDFLEIELAAKWREMESLYHLIRRCRQ